MWSELKFVIFKTTIAVGATFWVLFTTGSTGVATTRLDDERHEILKAHREQLYVHCRETLFFDAPVSNACFEALDGYFQFRRVQTSTWMEGYIFGSPYPAFDFGKRTNFLKFGVSDYESPGAPRWNDIFDHGERNVAVASVFSDESCRQLLEPGPIRGEMAERCNARLLVKYALHLGACVNGTIRLKRFNVRGGNKGGDDGTPSWRFELNKQLISTRYSKNSSDSRNKIAELIELKLNAAWLTRKCSGQHLVVFNSDLDRLSLIDLVGMSREQLYENQRISFDSALTIAARAGDDWALQSHAPSSPYVDPDYWASLHQLKPHLTHRLLAMTSVISEEQRAWHALKSYWVDKRNNSDLLLTDYVRTELTKSLIDPIERVLSDFIRDADVELYSRATAPCTIESKLPESEPVAIDWWLSSTEEAEELVAKMEFPKDADGECSPESIPQKTSETTSSKIIADQIEIIDMHIGSALSQPGTLTYPW